jgi:beta-glucosidase
MSAWIDAAAAVLEAWMMGQAGGGAIADVLWGKVNPSGRLAETFPARLVDTPAYTNFPGSHGQVRYGEGLFVGYRYYDAKDQPVLFPFGHGLSYTTFAYGSPRVSAALFKDVDGLVVAVDVTNMGQVAGQEVVQVYVHDRQSGLVRPPKELKGFAKVELQPGETKRVTIPLDFRAFAFYHPGHGQWITEDGEFDILVGASAADIRGVATATLQSTLDLPCILTRMATPRQWLADARGKVVFEPFFQQLLGTLAASFGVDPATEDFNEDAIAYLLDMPLPDVLDFQGDALPASPHEIVDGLLAQVRG